MKALLEDLRALEHMIASKQIPGQNPAALYPFDGPSDLHRHSNTHHRKYLAMWSTSATCKKHFELIRAWAYYALLFGAEP